jgi:hypothetical protein
MAQTLPAELKLRIAYWPWLRLVCEIDHTTANFLHENGTVAQRSKRASLTDVCYCYWHLADMR